jgi:hypothetical protein
MMFYVLTFIVLQETRAAAYIWRRYTATPKRKHIYEPPSHFDGITIGKKTRVLFNCQKRFHTVKPLGPPKKLAYFEFTRVSYLDPGR